jgi:hypothetical protein
MKRVTLLPHRNDWTEIQRDAVTMLDAISPIAEPGDVATWRRPRDNEHTLLVEDL